MRKTFFSSYLPSLLAIVAVGALAFALDYQTRALAQQDLRAEVEGQAEILRTRLESQIESGIFISRGLASLISREGEVSQREFSSFASDVTEDRPEVINIGWAPDLIITRVHPIEGNERAIGIDYRKLPAQLGDVLRARDTGQIVLVGPVDLVQGGKGFILRVPVYSAQDDDFAFRGILSTVFALEGFLTRAGVMADDLNIEASLARVNQTSGDTEVFYGDHLALSDNPVITDVRFPGGSWQLIACPKGGWASVNEEMTMQRLLLALLAAFILGPLIVANRLALARQRIIRNMEVADDRLKAFVRNSPGVFFTYVQEEGKKDRIEFITEACRDIWEAEPVEIYQHPGILWKGFNEDEIPGFLEEVERSRRSMKKWNYVWRYTARSGVERYLEGWGHPFVQDGGITRWDCLVVDTTEQRHREEEFQRQREIASQAQKQESIGQLTGGIAHDFNNMLAVVRGNMEMLQEDLEAEGIEDDERLDFVRGAITAAERGNDLTKKMLSFARRASLNPEELDLNDIVRELEDWSGRTLPATITLVNALEDTLPKVKIDRASTASALLNLMVNARDAMPDGGELRIATTTTYLNTLQVAAMPENIPPGDYVVLTLSDTGEGIASDKLDMIFEPFYTTKGPGAGSGLGLSMVQGFIRQSGGAIKVRSKVGKGTTVELYFHALKQTSPQAPVLRKDTPGAAQSMLRILVAEDEPEVRKVLERTLKRLGHTVLSAPDGDSALRLFQQDQDFDLLMTDMVMPGSLQGSALAKAVREIVPGFPVIVMTGYTDLPLHEDSSLLSTDIRLSKPVSRADLLRALETAMALGPVTLG